MLLDGYGEVIWTRTYGGPGAEEGVACAEVEGGYAIAGSTATGANGGYDILLVRTDESGEQLWQRSYGTPSWDLCYSMVALQDGFLLGGVSYGDGSLSGGAYVVRTDVAGEVLWTRTYGGGVESVCRSLEPTADGGFLVAGRLDTGNGSGDAFIGRYGSDGSEEWSSTLGGDSLDYFEDVVEMASGRVIGIGGSKQESQVLQILSGGLRSGWVLPWDRFLGNSADAAGAAIVEGNAEGPVFTGYNSLNLGSRDMIFTEVDPDGYFITGNNFGNGRPADGNSIVRTSDGGFLLAGWVENVGSGPRSCYVVRTGPDGQTASLDVNTYFDPTEITGSGRREEPWVLGSTLVTDELSIQLIDPAIQGHAELLDLSGAVLHQKRLTYPTTRFGLQALAMGTYMVRLVKSDGTYSVSRFSVIR